MTTLSLLALLSIPLTPSTGAQELKMMTYQMVFMRAVPTAPAPPDPAAMQKAHLDLLVKLNRDRTNLLFGPFLDNTDLQGIAIVTAPSAEAAKALFADDPFVKGGHWQLEVRAWYGPEGWFHPPSDPPTTEPLIFGFLKTGPNLSHPAEEAARLQAEHLAYMGTLHAQGKLVAAGPFMGAGDYRGIVIYRVATVEQARVLAAGDPAVKAGRLVIDARPWMTYKGILK